MSAPEEQIVAQIMEMCETVGFFHLKNVAGFDEAELLRDMKAFFALPDSVKRTLTLKVHAAENPNTYRGFIPFIDNDPSHKEMFDMGCDYATISEEEKKQPLVEETPFPVEPEHAHIKEKFLRHNDFRLQLSLKLIEYLAIGLGKDRDFFKSWFERESLSSLRVIRYLPRGQASVSSDALGQEELKMTTPEHTDSGFLTLLTTFGFPGLQIPVEGEYKFVKPERNNIVVNLGLLFSQATNSRFKATEHRVMDIGVERFSSPFFFEPKSSQFIPSNILNSDEAQTEPPIHYGKWLAKSMKRFGEWKDFELTEGA